MSTKSNRSSGTQHTQRGVNQGVVLVDPKTGLPVDVVFEGGKYKLAVTGSGGGGGPATDVNIISSIPLTLKDPVTGNLFKVEADGSINANVELDAADGDNVMIVGTEDGLFNGVQHPAKIDSNKDLHVKDTDANTKLQSIEGKLDSLQTELNQKTEPANAQNIRSLSSATDSVDVPGVATEAKQDSGNASLASIDSKVVSVDTGNVTVVSSALPTGAATEAKQDTGNSSLASIDSKLNTLGQKPMSGSVPVVFSSNQTALPVTLEDEPIKTSGTENGQPTGPEFTFVNNRRLQILAAKDRDQQLTYVDFGTKDQRITQIDYTSPSIGVGVGFVARKTFIYVLDGSRYRRTNITWAIV